MFAICGCPRAEDETKMSTDGLRDISLSDSQAASIEADCRHSAACADRWLRFSRQTTTSRVSADWLSGQERRCTSIADVLILSVFHISQLHHTSLLSPHPLILDLLSTCPTLSSILGWKLISAPSLFLRNFCLSRTERTDHRPACVLVVFGDC